MVGHDGVHQRLKRHGRHAPALLYPQSRQHGAQHIKIFFQPHALAAQIFAVIPARHVDVVVKRAQRLMHLPRAIAQRGEKWRIGAVDNGRIQPFHERGVALSQQPKRLAQFPAAHIQRAGNGLLNHIALRAQAQIPRQARHVEKAHVVITIRRGKAPAATAGFAGVEHGDIVLFFNGRQPRQYFGAHFGSDGVGVLRVRHSRSSRLSAAGSQAAIHARPCAPKRSSGAESCDISTAGASSL